MNSEILHKIQKHYGSTDYAHVSAEAAALRSESPHEEEDRSSYCYCSTCGVIEPDNEKVNPIFHPEIFLDG
jgi:hypothetical protein